jgi:hypothetical protein
MVTNATQRNIIDTVKVEKVTLAKVKTFVKVGKEIEVD